MNHDAINELRSQYCQVMVGAEMCAIFRAFLECDEDIHETYEKVYKFHGAMFKVTIVKLGARGGIGAPGPNECS